MLGRVHPWFMGGEYLPPYLEPGSTTTRQLVQLAEDKAWEQGQDRSLSVARAIYLHLPDDATEE